MARVAGNIVPTLNRMGGGQREPCVIDPVGAVRRITPRECERLMAFPDDATLVPYKGALASDGRRYGALGNSMVVSVMRYIGRRIQAVQSNKRRK
jgi:DNA (cytosine-5)-methyltransferase 1